MPRLLCREIPTPYPIACEANEEPFETIEQSPKNKQNDSVFGFELGRFLVFPDLGITNRQL
jgi:hypothetical protein